MKRIKKIPEQIFDFFIYSNLLISIASFLFTVQTALLFNSSASSASFFALTNFVCTFMMYNLQRIYQSTKPHNKPHLKWYERHKRLLFTMMLLLGSLYALILIVNFKAFQEGLLLYLPVGIISLFYFLPPFNLRRLPISKIFFISIVWVISSIFIPLLYDDMVFKGFSNLHQNEIFYIIAQFCFISSLCIPFDIRDIENDKQNLIKTLPVQLGLSKAKTIGIILMVIYMVLAQNTKQGLVYLICGIIGVILTIYSSQHKHRYYFSVLVDGLIIVQFLFFAFLFTN